MATKKVTTTLKTFTVMAKIEAEVSVDIQAESLADAVGKSANLGIFAFINSSKGAEFFDYKSPDIFSVYKQ